ncbi:hypothetical protein EC973_003226 [Apophysomyces ossiformis]|uniref:Uncharacterized protein n=1 Tax=Apophysomyces ossiformis TaxID=679940 RepID=A0A8H7EUL9_9FUNG|nr:hypothetical protein EC973_003226 [Apophysomyces ossiformis]
MVGHRAKVYGGAPSSTATSFMQDVELELAEFAIDAELSKAHYARSIGIVQKVTDKGHRSKQPFAIDVETTDLLYQRMDEDFGQELKW